MKTTFELRPKKSGINEKPILENLNTLENIWNISGDVYLAGVSFEYMTWADLELVQRDLHELGNQIINDAYRFGSPEKHLNISNK